MVALGAHAQLADDVIRGRQARGIPSWLLNPMEHAHIERLAGMPPGAYRAQPEAVYLAMQRAIGTCMLDQYIPTNPLSMGSQGYENEDRGATTGAEIIVRDEIVIDSPEAVVTHLELIEFPRLQRQLLNFDEQAFVEAMLEQERATQAEFGPDILKVPYGYVAFPHLAYFTYGYAPYFMAYALYPEVMERHFALQGELALQQNQAVARAYTEGGLPPLYRLDHDMADSRGTLVSIESLDALWFPHFARCLAPLLQAGIRLIWHCDGNLMAMVPRLLEVGLHGFQGFQYEDGMDYARICGMQTKDGDDLLIIGGVSVTRTLPHGTATEVKRELDFLVEHGPKAGLFLGASSSITPGVPWENMQTLVEGLRYYQEHGR